MDNYRFGFNGKEMDNEVKGTGSQYDYGFRIYDSRIGKFLSVDPLFASYPWFTPYQFAGNSPTWAIDLDGLETHIVTYRTNDDGSVTTTVTAYTTSNGNRYDIGLDHDRTESPTADEVWIRTIDAKGNVALTRADRGLNDNERSILFNGAKSSNTVDPNDQNIKPGPPTFDFVNGDQTMKSLPIRERVTVTNFTMAADPQTIKLPGSNPQKGAVVQQAKQKIDPPPTSIDVRFQTNSTVILNESAVKNEFLKIAESAKRNPNMTICFRVGTGASVDKIKGNQLVGNGDGTEADRNSWTLDQLMTQRAMKITSMLISTGVPANQIRPLIPYHREGQNVKFSYKQKNG